MIPISKLRFDALAGYSRAPTMQLVAEEIAWFQESDERLLGLIVRDLTDNDFACYVLGRDRMGRFRCVDLEVSIADQPASEEVLRLKMQEWSAQPDEQFYQGDEVRGQLDYFTPIVSADRLHPIFTVLLNSAGYSPAREIIKSMMNYYADVDGNFIQQFQTDGFDARLWELYLYAAFAELDYSINRDHPAPDFHCQGLRGEFFVEATSVNPRLLNGRISEPEPPDGEAERNHYFNGYVPIRFGSALISKLRKRYWVLEHVQGIPLLFAIQDFRALRSMTWSSTGLVEYLYGIRQMAIPDEQGRPIVRSERILEHRWEDKTIPSGFFFQPDAEHISAVIANPTGTITKFNRIGYVAGFGNRELRMVRCGSCYEGSIAPTQFVHEVHDENYSETWCEGMSVYHNPCALQPLSPSLLPNVAHHFLKGDRIVSRLPHFHPVGEVTRILPA